MYNFVQVEEHIAMPTLVLAVDQSFWMMSGVVQVLNTYWSVPPGKSCLITAFTLPMLVLGVKVCLLLHIPKGYLSTISTNSPMYNWSVTTGRR